MSDLWIEVWRDRTGHTSMYCGIARTEDGFAVDLFHGDTCIRSESAPSYAEAVSKAQAWESPTFRASSLDAYAAVTGPAEEPVAFRFRTSQLTELAGATGGR